MTSNNLRHAGVGLLLLALMAGLHRDVIFRGRSLVHSNHVNPFDARGLYDNYGDAAVPHTEWANRNLWLYANIRDAGATWWQWEPSLQFLKEAIERREWPFWDPYLAGGTPAMANLVPAFFFPPYLAMVLLGGTVALKNAYFLFLLWSASFLTYVLLRRHGLGLLAGLFGAVLVMTGGTMNQNLGAFAGQTIACLPLALYVTRVFLDAPGPRRAVLVACTYAAIALASFPPILLGVFGVTACYALVAIATRDCAGDRWNAARWWSAAGALSLMLVAWYYGPAIALARVVPQVGEIYRDVGLETMPFRNIYQLLSPTVMGGVQVYFKAPFASNGLLGHIPYVGAVCLIALWLAWPRSPRERTLFVTSAIVAPLILLKLFGVPPVQWLGHLPFFSHLHFSHYLGVPLGFPLVFLAALGIEDITRGRLSIPRGVFAMVIGVGTCASLWWIATRMGVFGMENASYWICDWKFVAIFTSATSILLLATMALRRWPLARVATVSGLCLVVVMEGLYNNTYPQPAAWDVFAHPVPYMRVLRKEAGDSRVLTFQMPPANTNEAFRVFSIDSLMAFNPPRMYRLYHHYMEPDREVFMRVPKRVPPDLVLDRLNISFIGTFNALTPIVADANGRGYERRFDNGYTTLFRRDTLPRFFFSSEYQVMPVEQALEAIASAPRREVLLEEDPGVPATPNTATDPAVQLVSYDLNAVTLTVDAPRAGLVYASESYFEGWTATVNDVRVPILAANYACRAIAVPAGTSRIVFTYSPPGLTAGLTISAFGIVLTTLLAVRSPRRLTPDEPGLLA